MQNMLFYWKTVYVAYLLKEFFYWFAEERYLLSVVDEDKWTKRRVDHINIFINKSILSEHHGKDRHEYIKLKILSDYPALEFGR